MQTVDISSDMVHQSHGVEVRERSLSSPQSTCQQLNDSLDICSVPELDHVEPTIGQEDLES